MKRCARFLVMLNLLAVLPASCSPATPFPPHSISYILGCVTGAGFPRIVRQTEAIDLAAYPNLKLRDGFLLKRAVCNLAGGDVQGYVMAVRKSTGKGFAVEPMNSAQGKFLFAPIKSAAAALEYVEFMTHETPYSVYGREHEYILSADDFEKSLSTMKGMGKVETIKTPPTDITRITEQSGGYLVELVYSCMLYTHRIEYLACWVHGDGSLELKEGYVFVKGPPGPVL